MHIFPTKNKIGQKFASGGGGPITLSKFCPGVVLGLISICSWQFEECVQSHTKIPSLLLLPVFGFVTFGIAPKGETRFSLFRNISQSNVGIYQHYV